MGEAACRQQLGVQHGQQQIQIDLAQTTQRICNKCEGKYFQPAVKIHMVSAILSPTGKELPVQVPVLLCMKCGVELELVEKPAIDA